jgi:hypothetical protein
LLWALVKTGQTQILCGDDTKKGEDNDKSEGESDGKNDSDCNSDSGSGSGLRLRSRDLGEPSASGLRTEVGVQIQER